MPYVTNFFGWDFFVGMEKRENRWTGVVRISTDGQHISSVIRCQHARASETLALMDAQELALEWSAKLEQSPQRLRDDAISQLKQISDSPPQQPQPQQQQAVQILERGPHYA